MRMHRLVLMVGLTAVAGFGCLAVGSRIAFPTNREEAEHGEGERKKSWSGRSYEAETRVVKTPARSETADGFDSERVWSGKDDWEPAIAVDPSSSNVYQMTTRYGSPECPSCADPAIIFRTSIDGGATWEEDQYLAKTGGTQNDPELEVAEDGAIYAAFMLNYSPGVVFTRSVDHGRTWSSPLAMGGRRKGPLWSDKPMLAISRDGHDVYLAFNATSSFVAASHDYGDHFAAAVKTSQDNRYWFHTGGTVAPDGSVYFTAVDYSQDYSGESHINVIRSADGGTTWTTTRIDTSAQMPVCPWSPGCYFGFFGPSAAIAVDRAGTLMVVYNASDVDGAPQQLYVRTSTDGAIWSERLEVSSGSAEVSNAFPAIAAGPNAGDFRIAWQDDRLGSTSAWNTWYRRTTDGGQTWSDDVRLSDLGSGAPYKSADGYAFPYGDYFEMAVDGSGTTHIIWGEGSSYTGPGGTWYTRGL